ncbi:HlyD family secretion protein [Desulfosporosinus metallidurans]|uniref:Putative Co/Zn/Cd efflux system membrane fusion protein n=1 Tax=Desulfosporosinus metallidurans TaxID=1888891 RepID=A0A1Q8R1C1_9FIRM|nr:efflux RND transporter periplasmic adaptor subunit [Desulfosporosinus metallidurans]OLN33423.1 putative Co/Zn/Cd efflux system membrane fusion protein [Desulfosporosinus metallidurans]
MKRIVLAILAMVIVLTGCGATGQTDKNLTSSSNVQASNPVFVMAGIIDANDKAGITSKISAKVASINAEVGTVVKKGDTLISFDTKDLEAQVAQAQAGVNTAQANLAKMQAGARPEQIAQAQAMLDSAKTSYLNAKNNYDRNQQLAAAGAISQSQLETMQTQLAASQAQYKSAQDQLDMLTKGETQETLNVLQAQVKQAQAALELAKTQLSYGTIVSPISGTVSAKNINVGELASPGVTLVSVVGVDTLYIKASLPDGLIGSVKVGQAVVVKVADIPDKEFTGEISVVDPVIDSRSRSVLVRIKLDNPDSILKPGMLAEIGLKK